MADAPQVATGATRLELIDLERRIGERGLALEAVVGPNVRFSNRTGRFTPKLEKRRERLSPHEEALIRAALLAMARPAP